MSDPTRVAGWGRLADGSVVTWTVAEGRKGRRWREVVARDAVTVHALLLETDPLGRFSHLELARADGLWTFHPEADGTLHGNHVRPGEAEVHHVVGWPFGSDDAIVVVGSPIGLAAVAWRLRTTIGERDGAELAGVVIGAEGGLLRQPVIRVGRLSPTGWRIGDWGTVEVDEAGLPILAGGVTRPLELA
jgi:hypothetical protein